MDYRRRRLSERLRGQLWLALIVGLTVIIQTTLLPTIFNAHLNLVLLAVVCWTLLADAAKGAAIAMYGGLLIDVVGYSPFGSHALALLLVTWVCSLAAERFPPDTWPTSLLLTIVLTPLYHLITQVFRGGTDDWLSWAIVVLVPAMIINAIAVLPTFLVLQWWNERKIRH